jgi:hypothetical protein
MPSIIENEKVYSPAKSSFQNNTDAEPGGLFTDRDETPLKKEPENAPRSAYIPLPNFCPTKIQEKFGDTPVTPVSAYSNLASIQNYSKLIPRQGSKEFASSMTNLEDLSRLEALGKLVVNESQQKGMAEGSLLFYYINQAGCYLIFLLLIFLILSSGIKVYTELYPTNFSSDGSKGKRKSTTQDYFFYIGWIIVTCILYFIRNIFYSLVIAKASKKIFEGSFSNIIRRPMSFFDTTPSGQIITRFSKDLSDVEKVMPTSLMELINYTLVFFTAFVLLTIVSPFHGILVMIAICYLTSVVSISSQVTTELARLEKLTMSPVISILGEMIQGQITFQMYSKSQWIL